MKKSKMLADLEKENAELKADIVRLKAEIWHLNLTAVEVADLFNSNATMYREAVRGTNIDTNSRLAASHRGRAKSYDEAADRVRSRFKIKKE